MLKTFLVAGLAFLITACAPIATVPPEQHADCSYDQFSTRPGQSAPDPTSDSAPGYVDIVGVKSNLEGEMLTATFYLRDIPQELEFNRDGVETHSLEYMWSVEVNIEGGNAGISPDQIDYRLVTFALAKPIPTDASALTLPFEDRVKAEVWKRDGEPKWKNQQDDDRSVTVSFYSLTNARILVSHDQNTLTLIGEIPGITPESSLTFAAYDILAGNDWISCQPS